MKQNIFRILSILLTLKAIQLNGMEGGRVDGSMSREGMGFHQYHGGYHRSDGGYGYGRAYGAFGRHFGRYGHRGYGRYGDIGYVRKEANPADNIIARSAMNRTKRPIAIQHKDNFYTEPVNERAKANRTARALENKSRGGQYWGYYSPYYQYGLYPWYNNGDPYYYYQRADYYPWYYGFNPAWLWW